MRKLVFTTLVVVVLSAGGRDCLALEYTGVRSTVGDPTVPPSAGGVGLIRSPNPIDTTGNLMITGNVRGGRHFRGVVPYRATFDFRDTLGSTSLDAFFRDSVGAEDVDIYRGRTRSFYSTTRTVTSFPPGRTRIFRPPAGTRIGRVAKDIYGARFLPPLGGQREVDLQQKISSMKTYGLTELTPDKFRPMSVTTEQLERFLSRDTERFIFDRRSKVEETTEFEKDRTYRDWRLDALEQEKQLTDSSKETDGVETLVDVYEQMIQIIYELEEENRSSASKGESEEVKEGAGSEEQLTIGQGISETALSVAKSRSILGKHKTFAAHTNDRFNYYIKAAEEYLKKGMYYRAADSYTLASVYKPQDPLAYAGKSYALFAAGEYMSSAYFLTKALDIFPEYARFKIDLVALLGDKDKLETRIADAEEWLANSDAGELHFLVGYVYYQMGRSKRAKEAIERAYEKMPDSRAVILVKKVINGTIK